LTLVSAVSAAAPAVSALVSAVFAAALVVFAAALAMAFSCSCVICWFCCTSCAGAVPVDVSWLGRSAVLSALFMFSGSGALLMAILATLPSINS
jgi:hypothetical protein